MQKKAEFKPAWHQLQLLNPALTLVGSDRATVGLPQLADNPRTNLMLWNSLGSLAAGLTLGGLIKGITGADQANWWRKHRNAAEADKVNAIQPLSHPDTDLTDTEQREKRRVRELQKQSNSPVQEPPERGPNILQRYLTNVTRSALPLAAGGLGLWFGTQAVSNQLQESREEALDQEIAAKRNQLDSLHRQILDMRLRGRNVKTAVPKQASSLADDITAAVTAPVRVLTDDASTAYHGIKGELRDIKESLFGRSPRSGTDASRGAIGTLADIPSLSAGALALLGAYTTYQFAKRRDENRAKLKQMQSLAATNMTHMVPRLQLELDADNNVKVSGN